MNFRKVATSENTLTFERFCAGLKICLLRNNADSRSEKEMTVDLLNVQISFVNKVIFLNLRILHPRLKTAVSACPSSASSATSAPRPRSLRP